MANDDQVLPTDQLNRLTAIGRAAVAARCAFRAIETLKDRGSDTSNLDRYESQASRLKAALARGKKPWKLQWEGNASSEGERAALASLKLAIEAALIAGGVRRNPERHHIDQIKSIRVGKSLENRHKLQEKVNGALEEALNVVRSAQSYGEVYSRFFDSLRADISAIESFESSLTDDVIECVDVSPEGQLGPYFIEKEEQPVVDINSFIHDVPEAGEFTRKWGIGNAVESPSVVNGATVYKAIGIVDGKRRGVSVSLQEVVSEPSELDLGRLDTYRHLPRHEGLAPVIDCKFVRGNAGRHSSVFYITDTFDSTLERDWYLLRRKRSSFTSTVRQLVSAASHLNRNGLQHLGISPQNVFSMGASYRLGRIGLNDGGDRNGAIPGYSPPEMMDSGELDQSADCYSLTATVVSAAVGEHFFQMTRGSVLAGQKSEKHIRRRLDEIGIHSESLVEKLVMTLSPSPQVRPAMPLEAWINGLAEELWDSLVGSQTKNHEAVASPALHLLETIRAYTANEEPRF